MPVWGSVRFCLCNLGCRVCLSTASKGPPSSALDKWTRNPSSQPLPVTVSPLRTGTTSDFSHYCENIVDTRYLFVELLSQRGPHVALFPGKLQKCQRGDPVWERNQPGPIPRSGLEYQLTSPALRLLLGVPLCPGQSEETKPWALPQACCVTLGKSLPLSRPQFPYLLKEQVRCMDIKGHTQTWHGVVSTFKPLIQGPLPIWMLAAFTVLSQLLLLLLSNFP